MSTDKISAAARTEFGKGAARRIRRENKVPAVIYGHGNDPVHVTLPGHETWLAIKHGGANALLEVEVDGTTHLALTKQVQVDPIRRTLEHIDFIVVRRGEKVSVDIPIQVLGEAAPETLVTVESETVQIEAEATHIPEFLEVSVEGVEAGTQITAADLNLPSGTVLLTDAETLVINVVAAQSAEALEADLEAAEAEAGIERAEPEAAGGEGSASDEAAGGDSDSA